MSMVENTSSYDTGYECVMCMESLSGPAPPALTPGSNKESVSRAAKSPSSRGRRKKSAGESPEYLSEICGTWCGHLFHRACLDRWFNEQGKKTCPSCRKVVTVAKIIRMYLPRSPGTEHPSPTGKVVGHAGHAGHALNTTREEMGNLEDRSLPPCNCTKTDCLEVHTIHEILVKDFNELKNKYEDAMDENQILKVQKVSLEEEFNRWKREYASNTKNASVPPLLTAKRNLSSTEMANSSPTKRARKTASTTAVTLNQ